MKGEVMQTATPKLCGDPDREHLNGHPVIECIRADDDEAAILAANGWMPVQRCDECFSQGLTDWSDEEAALRAFPEARIYWTVLGQVMVAL